MRTFWIIHTNCDCCSSKVALSHNPERIMIGPRCPGCNRILGIMQWNLIEKVRAKNAIEATTNYNKRTRTRSSR